MRIRRRLLLYVLPCALASLTLMAGVALYGLSDVRGKAAESGARIGRLAAERTDEAMRRQVTAGLSQLSRDNASQVDFLMGSVRRDTERLSREMTAILSEPGRYPAARAEEPRHLASPALSVYLTFAPDARRGAADFEAEIAETANLSDFLLRTVEESPLLHSAYAASERGFMLQADAYAEGAFASPDAAEAEPFEMRGRPWYRAAMKAGHAVFTEVFTDYYSGDLSVTCAAPYYRAGEPAGVVGLDCFLKQAENVVLASQLGEQGESLIMDRAGRVLFSTAKDGPLAASGEAGPLSAIAQALIGADAGVTETDIDGRRYFAAYAPLRNVEWTFVILVDRAEAMAPLWAVQSDMEKETSGQLAALDGRLHTMRFEMAAIALLVALFTAAAVYAASERLTRPLRSLEKNVRSLAEGDFTGTVEEIKTGDEIEHLSAAFREMTERLGTYLSEKERMAAEKAHTAAEMNVARNIQQGLLPRDFLTERTDVELAASMEPAREVGGDFYDFYLLDDRRLVLTIADVSDKGIPAAMFMLVSRTILKNSILQMRSEEWLAEAVSRANGQLAEKNEEMMFVTAFAAVLDLETGRLTCVNAGHNPLYIRRADGKRLRLEGRHGIPLGVKRRFTYRQQEETLAPGDLLLLYTDGATEAMDAEKNLYGRRIEEVLEKEGGKPADAFLKALRADLRAHMKDAPQSDDITLLAVRRENDA